MESGAHYVQVLGFDGHLGSYRLEASIVGDVTENGVLDADDIDALHRAIARGESDRVFDLNDDEMVDPQDADYLIRDVLASSRGDADLSGSVNFADFLTLSANFGNAGVWAEGDFSGDGIVAFDDFLLLSGNFGKVRLVRHALTHPLDPLIAEWLAEQKVNRFKHRLWVNPK